MKIISYLLLFLILPFFVQSQIKYTNVKSGLGTVTDIANAGDGTNRIFMANKNGTITILSASYATLGTLLNINSLIATTSEEGLLGLAFHPNFASNGYFFVNYVPTGTKNSRISRFTASPPSSNSTVLLSTEKVILTVTGARFDNHKGGDLAFGPDGFLYITTGDGGSGGDPDGNGQNGNALLGKILRINITTSPDSIRYVIPGSNPFVTNPNVLDEIWDMGVRNPWRISFDRQTGDLWIADVGQGAKEEINVESVGGGGKNYGWNCREGLASYSGCTSASGVPTFTDPIFQYLHCSPCNASTVGFGNSITGGFVYRGNVTSNAALKGYYICADYVSHHAWIIKQTAGASGFRQALDVKTIGSLTSSGITSFGELENGEIMAGLENGSMGIISVTAALPVGLIRFNATVVSEGIHLDWNTGSEINTLQYHIERSRDGQQFEELSKVSAKGKAGEYHFIDTRPFNNHNYYRLKIEDLGGTIEYSAIIYQKMQQINRVLAYYRRESREIKFDLGPLNNNERINLYTLQGALVKQVNHQDSKIGVEDLPEGIYFISMPGAKDRLFQKILIY